MDASIPLDPDKFLCFPSSGLTKYLWFFILLLKNKSFGAKGETLARGTPPPEVLPKGETLARGTPPSSIGFLIRRYRRSGS